MTACLQVQGEARATLVVGQQDSAGLCCVGDRIEERIPAKQGINHLAQLYQHLETPKGSGGGNFGELVEQVTRRIAPRSMVVIGEQPPAPAQVEPIVVRLVTSLDPDGRLVSDLEELQPVVRTIFDDAGTKTIPVGERATLWVRNASVDGKADGGVRFTFEQFYQGKYINRSAKLEINPNELGFGEHVINPGDHRFTCSPDGTFSTKDPEMKIEGRTISLRLHRVEVLAVDGSKTGPPEFRLVGAELGLMALGPEQIIAPGNLPAVNSLTNLLSHARKFYPLAVYLPSNTVGQGYALYPSWQAFHLTPDGKVDLAAKNIVRVPGIEVSSTRIVIPYRTFSGKLSTKTSLAAGVGNVSLANAMDFSPTIDAINFRAGLGRPDESFFLPVDSDFSRNPNKFFLADNTADDPHAVRILALEWGHPVLVRGETAAVSLRFLEREFAEPEFAEPEFAEPEFAETFCAEPEKPAGQAAPPDVPNRTRGPFAGKVVVGAGHCCPPSVRPQGRENGGSGVQRFTVHGSRLRRSPEEGGRQWSAPTGFARCASMWRTARGMA